MERRYSNMAKLGVRHIDGYNKRVKMHPTGRGTPRTVQTGFDGTGKPIMEEQRLISRRHTSSSLSTKWRT